jgi:uncharacterized protein
MRIYAAADIHGAQHRLNIILKNIEQYSPDLMIICGDITQFGPGEIATNFLNQIPVDTLALQGNIDTVDVSKAITNSKAKNIDCSRLVIKKLSFIGIGGDSSSPLALTQITDGKTSKLLCELIDKKTILITHVPPYGFQDKVFINQHIGNKELRDLIESYAPRLVLCGHVHEDPGVTTYKTTTIVNCSLGKRTEGAIIDTTDEIKVKILE